MIDDCFAFCGGIDMTDGRWDTRDHADDDPRRVGPDGQPYGPWHDATMALDGPGRRRAGRARARALALRDRHGDRSGRAAGDCWPDGLAARFRATCEVAISRTRPDYRGLEPCREIERLSLDLIARARRFIYAESQYFASRRIAEAIARRLAEPDGPEIVLVNPEQADGWLEQVAMDTARARLSQAIGEVDARRRFRIYHPVTEGGRADLRPRQDHGRRRRSCSGSARPTGTTVRCGSTPNAT